MEQVYPTVYQDHNNGINTFYHIDPYRIGTDEKLYSVGHIESLTGAINASTEIHHSAWRDGVLDVEQILEDRFNDAHYERCSLEYLTSIQYERDRDEYVERELLEIEQNPKLLLHVVSGQLDPF